MDTFLKAMKAFVASCTELFPVVVESLEEGQTSSSYSGLTPYDIVKIHDAAVESENQHVEELDQVEDITALTAPPVSATEVMVSNATPIFATVRKKTLDGCHMAEVRTPSLATAFQVVARDPPPLAILAPGFPRDNQLSVPLAPDVAETVDRVGVIRGPNGHECQCHHHVLHLWQRTEWTVARVEA